MMNDDYRDYDDYYHNYYDDDDYYYDDYYYDDDDNYYDDEGNISYGYWDWYEDAPAKKTMWQSLVWKLKAWYLKARAAIGLDKFDDIPF